MHIDNLVLEITRKCNLQCPHCIRGNTQRLVMTHDIICSTFKHIESIGSLTITGGEPSLATEVFEDINLSLWWRKIQVQSFYIVSNGCPHNRYGRFLRAVDKLYQYCDEQEACSFTISRDQFHDFEPSRYRIFQRYMDEEYYGEDPSYFHPKGRDEYIEKVIGEGRAVKTQVGFEPIIEQKPWKLDGDYVTEQEVCVSANGNVTSCCDMSYARIDSENKGNVLKMPLPQIIEGYCVKKEEAVEV